ncbi:heavy metal translocating P-type ATPase [Polynucleobacter sp. JS-Mosq-20-D10]|uniref:heavy metal translocating P-type ATPase n=1 Tax=Polynucleobacter sp. JS-Mosq-20-D10 TaxID=2576922 RepID=UPI001BFD4AF9|nr:heavy metal translocating P-type ATPase [Polynucleobacter sp. JS-Mosq-20-D10]QWE00041.1 heavy metal translocating P-type ATPase [Polynucleobacter sp. JS-Mosq-20-D10]
MSSSLPSNSCYHCGSFILPNDSYELELGDVNRQFCCAGCMAVAQTIHGEGLEVFYARRAQSSDKPATYLASNEIPDGLAPYDDPSLLSRYTRPSGDGGYLETTLRLEKIRCAACVWLCEQHLRRTPGVKDVQINYVSQKVKVEFSPEKTSLARLLFEIERIGYEAWPFEPSVSIEKSKKERRQLLTRLGVALLGMMQVMMYAWPTYVGDSDITVEYGLLLGWSSWALTVPVMTYSAGPIFRAAWRSVASFGQTHMLGMDVPIALALTLAFSAGTVNLVTGTGQGYFDSITMFVAFILAARYVELLARQDAQGGAEALAKQLPATCERVPNYPSSQQVEIVPVVNCSPGEVLRVPPGDVVPADGILIEYESSLDESLLTGESKPIDKQIGDRVYAGTHNILNPILMRIDAVGQSTRIAGIAALLDQALQAKPVMVSLAEKWAGYFVGFLLMAAFLSSAIWYYIDPSRAWTVLVSVLVASCPCALSLAVPTAMAAAQGAVTKLGLLIVRGHVLEGLVKATDLVLDKTGTLTMGQPELKEVLVARPDFSREDALRIAASMEAGQKHPLALSLLRAAEAENLALSSLPEAVINQLGKGLSSGTYRLGSAAWLGVQQIAQEGQYGQVHLADSKGLIASFLFLDTPRAGLEKLLTAVRSHKITVHLVSGDDLATVAWWAQHVGIDRFKGACSPEDKYRYIAGLQNQGRFVWAIGDGINDAPLLARADVSIAVGAGAPLATAGADAILTASSLAPLANSLLLADKTQRIIKENLMWALVYNLLAIPIAMMGWVNPWVAGIGMSLSSLGVTLNAWRLRKA